MIEEKKVESRPDDLDFSFDSPEFKPTRSMPESDSREENLRLRQNSDSKSDETTELMRQLNLEQQKHNMVLSELDAVNA